ncbi:MAG: hypothetical protein R3F49_17815 [Planctomycetota bacterium]
MKRKEFLKLLAGVVGGIALPRVLADIAYAADSGAGRGLALDESFLVKGLNALARAHQMSAMAGHLGAAVLAGYFVEKQRPGLDPDVCNGIKADLERVMGGESLFGSKMAKSARITDSELFADFPKERSNEGLIDGIAEALEKNIKAPRESGHNVIFAALAMRALKARPDLATPSIVDGIRKLISLFDDADAGKGYYGKAKGWVAGRDATLPEADDGQPQYTDEHGMVQAVLAEIIKQDPEVRRRGFGGLIHVNNHAAAITDLARSGYPELAAAGIASHHQHLRLWRSLPNVAGEFGAEPSSAFSPYTAAYWTSGQVPYDRALLTHRVKTMCGFDALLEAFDDEQVEAQACDKLRYLM